MTRTPQLARIAHLFTLLLLASSATDCAARENPLLGTWRWDNARTLREFELPTEGSESLKQSAAKAKRFVEAINQEAASNVQMTYTEHDCIEVIVDSRGNELSRRSSPYRVIQTGPGFVIVEQKNSYAAGKLFFQDNSFYVEVKVGEFTYKDYFTKVWEANMPTVSPLQQSHSGIVSRPVRFFPKTKMGRCHMDIIHFTESAADALKVFGAKRASFVPLADGEGDTHVSCLHLEPGGTIAAPSIDHAASLLVVHGSIKINRRGGGPVNINLSAGMGCVTAAQEPYDFSSETGAIILIVESTTLTPNPRGISSPGRIAGARWPPDAVLLK